MFATTAIILAAGRGRRMGADKALLDLGGRTAIQRVADACTAGGVADLVIVRSEGGAALPELAGVRVVTVPAGGEMLDSVRRGLDATRGASAVLVFPVDYAMVGAATVRAVLDELEAGGEVVLPLHGERPGHPIGLAEGVFPEVQDAGSTLREVVGADRARVRVVPVQDRWIHQDLDTPEDLAAARSALPR